MVFIGTAGWAISREHSDKFLPGDSHLHRYAQHFNTVELNSSFYRPHKKITYRRWASSVPEDFRFSVKMPRAITHIARLRDIDEPLGKFVSEVEGLGDKLGVVLVQLPPSLQFDPKVSPVFLARARAELTAELALEARHFSWFTEEAALALAQNKIHRVTADPPISGATATENLFYLRLHGSPKIYYSEYSEDSLVKYSQQIIRAAQTRKNIWCVFDNTAQGFAVANAFFLKEKLSVQWSRKVCA